MCFFIEHNLSPTDKKEVEISKQNGKIIGCEETKGYYMICKVIWFSTIEQSKSIRSLFLVIKFDFMISKF